MKKKNPVEKQTMKSLVFRRKLINFVLRSMRTDPVFINDERTPEAIKRHEEMFKEVDGEIRKRNREERGGTEPGEIVIDLKPATLSGKVFSLK